MSKELERNQSYTCWFSLRGELETKVLVLLKRNRKTKTVFCICQQVYSDYIWFFEYFGIKIFLTFLFIWLSSVQSLSHVRLFVTPWIAAHQASLSITNSRSSLRLMSIESVMPSSHVILCRPLLLLPPIPPSISLFQWVNSSHEVAKVLEFQLYHHSFQRHPRADLLQNGLVSIN